MNTAIKPETGKPKNQYLLPLKIIEMSLSKTERVTGIIFSVLLLVVTLFSTIFFLGKLNMSLLDWVSFNSCSPTSFLYLGFFAAFMISKKESLLVVTALPIYYLGTLSMFVLPWTGTYLFAHLGHIIMTLNWVWALYVVLRHKNYKALATGLLAGLLVFAPWIACVQTYNQAHAEEIINIMQEH